MVGTPCQRVFQDKQQNNSLERTSVGKMVKVVMPMPKTVVVLDHKKKKMGGGVREDCQGED